MKDEEQPVYLSIPGHVSAAEAAEILNVSYERVLQLIRGKRFSAVKVSRMYMIPRAEVEDFKQRRNSPGRIRRVGAAWHLYNRRVKVFSLQIVVLIRTGQQDHFEERVRWLSDREQHTFKGTMIRVIWQSKAHPEQVKILLVWKSNEMPDEATRLRELEAFQRDFADILDWETAEIEEGDVLLST